MKQVLLWKGEVFKVAQIPEEYAQRGKLVDTFDRLVGGWSNSWKVIVVTDQPTIFPQYIREHRESLVKQEEIA